VVIVIDEIPNCGASVMTSATPKVTNTNVSAFSRRMLWNQGCRMSSPRAPRSINFSMNDSFFSLPIVGVARCWGGVGGAPTAAPGACVVVAEAPTSAMEWLAADGARQAAEAPMARAA
jgi:hypothetical protein